MLNSILALTGLLCSLQGAQPSQAAIQGAFEQIEAAACLIRYSSEITNPGTGEISKRDNNALGLLVSPKGLLLAHGHMALENSEPFNIRVTVGQGEAEKEYAAVLLKKPENVNVVFLQIQDGEGQRFPYLTFSPSANLELGAPVAIFGLLSETLDYNVGVEDNLIGAILDKPRRTYCLGSGVRFGYVGGPVIDEQGRIAGVVGFDLSRNEGGELYVRSGHPLVYQASLFQKYIDSPPSEHELASEEDDAYLGVFTQPLTDDFAEYWGLPKNGGLIVSTVVPGSPAEEIALQPGDIIISFNGTPIESKQDREVVGFTKLVRDIGADVEVPMRILRDGEPVELKVTVGKRPRSARDAGEFEEEIFGLTVREITTDVRIALNLAEDVQGVIVRRVKSGSTAQIGKIRPGVIIMRFGEFPVANLDDFKQAVEKVAEAKPEEVTVFARVGSVTGFFRLAPRWPAETE